MPNDVLITPSTAVPAEAADVDNAVHVFISYASADRDIATALYEELTEIDRNRVVCFLDTKTIESGEDWQEDLEKALRRADWLICVYTGEQSEYCGYEVGVFVEANKTSDPGKRRDTRIVCLHNEDELPGLFRNYQNKLITSPTETSAGGAAPDEFSFFQDAPISKFLADFYKYKNLYVARDAADGLRQQQTLIRQAKRITSAFSLARGRDEKSSTPTQLGIEVRFPRVEGGVLTAIPDTAEVSGTYQSLGLFDLMPPMMQERLPRTSWAALRAACGSEFRRDVPWMEKLERDMILAANGRAVGTNEATFKSHDKIFRAILARHVEYYNGSQVFSILFVETLPRAFLGKKNTSMLLAGLVLASRFRFAYLEEKEQVMAARFGDRLSNEEFEAGCRQLRYDLEQMQHEAADFGLLDPATFIKSFGSENKAKAESFLANWAKTEKRLYDKLAHGDVRVTDQNRAAIKQSVIEFLSSVETENEKFMVAAIDVYREQVLATFGPGELKLAA
ncbi:MAG TPA: toll/interleukin-1 receptor domain-containing protein [Burkholderiales bacterium]|nr:toll/interleukin-1 receptor domain-containing protein [Burkholderiales bacterium]